MHTARYYCCFESFSPSASVTNRSLFARDRFRRGRVRRKMGIFTEDGKRARVPSRRHGNVLSYEGNICKQVIDALERRLDKWRTVPLLFKRPRTREWIFCSQKARPDSVREISIHGFLVHDRLCHRKSITESRANFRLLRSPQCEATRIVT